MQNNNYVLCDIHPENDIDVRLVGIINDTDCAKILNDEHEAKKVFVSKNVLFDDFTPYYNADKRFIIVVNGKSKLFLNDKPIIFISPIITSACYVNKGWNIFLSTDIRYTSNIFRFMLKKVEDKTKYAGNSK